MKHSIKYILPLVIILFTVCSNNQNNNKMETEVPTISNFPIGEENRALAQYFSGKTWVAPLTGNSELNVPISNVTFEPGCRNNWHSHSGGQILVAVGGVGYYQERGKPAVRMEVGDVIEIAPNVVHWHGASPDSWFAHLAIKPNPQNNENTWLTPVTDEEYAQAMNMDVNTINAQPKTNALNAQQQGLVIISALTAVGDLEKLETGLNTALDAGLTVNEIKEALVQLYAYCGFPRSLNAINTFRVVLDERKEKGIKDNEGKEIIVENNVADKYEQGRKVLETLTKTPQSKPAPGFGEFAPRIDAFLKEHLFADVFASDVLSWKIQCALPPCASLN